MVKVVKAYSLDKEVIEYIHKLAKKMDKSDSFALNHLLTQAALADKIKKG